MLGPFKNLFQNNDNDNNDEEDKETYILDVNVSERIRKSFIVRQSDDKKSWLAQEIDGANSFKYDIADGDLPPEEVGKKYSDHLKKRWQEDLDRIDDGW